MRCHTPLRISSKEGAQYIVNCGRCPYCKKRRVSSWVFRLLQEEKLAFSSYFVTLTYDTRSAEITRNGFLNLSKRHFQLFMKRLRKMQKSKIKYYACGEYGGKTYRPHYHAIMFNIEDVESINKAWNMGQVHIGSVSGASIAYTAKYIDKQARIPMHKNDDRQKEFSLMSKGLGKNYVTPNTKAWHKADLSRMYVTHPDGIKVAMPKYYRDLIYDDDEKEKQRFAIMKLDEQAEKETYRKFVKYYKNSDIDFDYYIDMIKKGQYTKFYNQKKRFL